MGIPRDFLMVEYRSGRTWLVERVSNYDDWILRVPRIIQLLTFSLTAMSLCYSDSK